MTRPFIANVIFQPSKMKPFLGIFTQACYQNVTQIDAYIDTLSNKMLLLRLRANKETSFDTASS